MTVEHWTLHQKMVLALCGLAIVLDGFDTQVIGFAAPALLADWGITKADLAPILGIGLLGMTIGAAIGGYVGDRLGRRTAMIGSALVFGLATGSMAAAGNLWELGILRLVAGLGLGGALPIAAALVAEFTPANRRSLAVSISIVCIPTGGVVGGLFAAPLLPLIGWKGLFLIAGALPLVVALLLFLFLPESPSFLKSRLTQDATLEVPPSEQETGAQPSGGRQGFFRTLSEQGLWGDTVGLWAAFSVSLMANYLYFNWLPVLLSESKFDLSAASFGLLIFNLGSVTAGIAAGALSTRTGTRLPLSVLASTGAVTALLLMILPLHPEGSPWLLPALAVQGFCLGGTQILLYALAAHVFPVEIRATGIGSAASLGRIGAVISSGLGAVVLAWASFGFFLTIGSAMVIGTVCILLVRRHDEAGSKSVRGGA